jgi:hypothetical protein
LSKKQTKDKYVGEFEINKSVNYWLYSLKDDSWKTLTALYKNEDYCYYVPTIENKEIKKKDIIFIYQRHKSPKLNGFVGVCNASEKFTKNISKKKFFNDVNLSRFYLDTISMDKFDEPIRITQIDKLLIKKTSEFKSHAVFKSKYISKQNTILTQIPQTIGFALLEILITMSEKIPDNTSDFVESSGESSIESSDESSSDESELSDDNTTLIVKGHIPIIMMPCKLFTWHNDPNVMAKMFKKHYKTCSKCEKTDNNNCQFTPFLESENLYFKELKNEEKIDDILKYYFNLKNYVFKLLDDDKNSDHVLIYRINNRSHVYHRAILIVW